MNDGSVQSGRLPIFLFFPNWLGDAVMATGLLALLHAHRRLQDGRNLHLTVGVRPAWAPLFRDDPRIDELLLIERNGRHRGRRGLLRLGQDLRRNRFAATVLGPPSLRAALAAVLGGIPLRVGYRGDGRGVLLNVPVNPLPRGRRHHARELVELGVVLLARLGRRVDPLALPRGSSLPGCRGLTPHPCSPDVPRFILAPGATYGLAKNWPLERVAEFVRLALDSGGEVVALGDQQADGFVKDLAAALGVKARDSADGRQGLVNLAGRTSLTEAVSLIKSARSFVGNDSGLMHLAAALEVPTIGVFGSSNPDWTAPLGARTRAVVAQGFPCRPCYRKTCNQETFCLDTITGLQVWQEMTELLATGNNAPGKVTP